MHKNSTVMKNVECKPKQNISLFQEVSQTVKTAFKMHTNTTTTTTILRPPGLCPGLRG